MVFCGLFRDCMNENPSYIKNRPGDSRAKMVGTYMRSKYSSDLSSYKSACKKDESLKSFDSSLHERTNKVIGSLFAQAKTQPLNEDSLMEVYEFLLELNEDTDSQIIKCKGDVLKNEDLISLVHVYFKSTSKTLDFYNTVEKYVRKTEISQLIIEVAVKQFETETMDPNLGGGSKKNKYAKTLEQLSKFKAAGDPIDSAFLSQYDSVYDEQVLLLEELRKLNKRLDKKYRNSKTWRILSNVLFGAAFVSVLVFSVVAAAMIGPQVVSAAASASSALFQAVGIWSNEKWKKHEKAVKRPMKLVSTTEKELTGNKLGMGNVKAEVENLKVKIKAMMDNVEFAVERKEDEEAIITAMEKIKKHIDEFTKKIEQVGERVAEYRQHIMLGRVRVLGEFFNNS